MKSQSKFLFSSFSHIKRTFSQFKGPFILRLTLNLFSDRKDNKMTEFLFLTWSKWLYGFIWRQVWISLWLKIVQYSLIDLELSWYKVNYMPLSYNKAAAVKMAKSSRQQKVKKPQNENELIKRVVSCLFTFPHRRTDTWTFPY